GTVLTRTTLHRAGSETVHLEQTAPPDGSGGDTGSVVVDSSQTFTLDSTSLDVGSALHRETVVLDRTGAESYHFGGPASGQAGFTPSLSGHDTFHLHGVSARGSGDFVMSESDLADNEDAIDFLGADDVEAHGSFSLSSVTLDKSGSENYDLYESR